MVVDFVLAVNDLRKKLGSRGKSSDPDVLRLLARDLSNDERLRREPVVQCLIDDLRDYGSVGMLKHTKQHINEKHDHSMCSLFDVSYFPTLSLDCFSYRPIEMSSHLASRYPSNTMPVRLNCLSDGFAARVVVALFPENHIDKRQMPNDLIFYFIDKFIERHKRVTVKMIESIVDADAFTLLRSASDEEIEQAACNWVWLHEFHHRKGHMPIPEYLFWKTPKPLAGLEELRVDVSGMLVCLEDSALPEKAAEMTYQFILAERLLRYAVEGIPRPNYDAVASQLLFNYLLQYGGIALTQGKISIFSRVPMVLRQFLDQIESIEKTIQFLEPAAVQQQLLTLVNQYTIFDPVISDYRHIDFFSEVKRRLGV